MVYGFASASSSSAAKDSRRSAIWALSTSDGAGREPASGLVRPRYQPSRPLARLEHPVRERVAHELGARLEPELLLDVLAMCLDRPDRQVELIGDLTVRVAEGDASQDVDLTLGQVVGRARRRLGGDPRPELRIEVDLAVGGAADCLHE